MTEDKKEVTFEAALKRLEEIVNQLEEGSIPLDDSLEIFEEGVRLSKLCAARLADVEKKVEVLTEEHGELKFEDLENFEPS